MWSWDMHISSSTGIPNSYPKRLSQFCSPTSSGCTLSMTLYSGKIISQSKHQNGTLYIALSSFVQVNLSITRY